MPSQWRRQKPLPNRGHGSYFRSTLREIPKVRCERRDEAVGFKEAVRTWLIKIVEGRYRCWDDFLRYGMVSAGHDDPPSAPLKLLSIGDEVYAFLGARGYVGHGEVTRAALLAEHFVVDGDFVAMDGSARCNRVKLTDILLLRRSDMRKDGAIRSSGNGSLVSSGSAPVPGKSRSVSPECKSRGTRWKNSTIGRRGRS